MALGSFWSVGIVSVVHITITPFSVSVHIEILHKIVGLDAVSAITQIFVFAVGGVLRQATSARGKRLYRPGTLEVDTDPATGMRNMSPWFPSDQAERSGARPRRFSFAHYFIIGDPGGALELDLELQSSKYRLLMFGPRGSLDLHAKGVEKTDRLRLKNIGLGSSSLLLRSGKDQSYDVVFSHEANRGEQVREFRVNNLKLAKNGSVYLTLADNQRALSIESFDGSIAGEVKIIKRTLYEADSLEPLKVALEAGESRVLRPSTWVEFPWAELRQRKYVKGRPIHQRSIIGPSSIK